MRGVEWALMSGVEAGKAMMVLLPRIGSGRAVWSLCIALVLLAVSCEQRPVGPEPSAPGGRWDGEFRNHTFSCVWAASAHEFFIGGSLPSVTPGRYSIYRYDNQGWSRTPVPFAPINIWGRSPTDVFAAVAGDTVGLLHFDGASWTPVETGRRGGLHDVWGDATGQLFAAGGSSILHFDGAEWTTMQTTARSIYRLWGSSSSDVFAGGASGTILHFDGAEWSVMETPVTWDIRDLYGTSPSDVWAVTDFTILHYDGESWRIEFSSDDPFWLRGVWTDGMGKVAAVGFDYRERGLLITFDGASWSWSDLGAAWRSLYGISGAADGEALAVGYGQVVVRYDGEHWVFVDPGRYTHLNAVWGTGPENTLTAAELGFVFRHDGMDMWPMRVSTQGWDVNGVWGSATDDVFAVGDAGLIAHFDGSTWQEMGSGVFSILHDVWGSGPDDVYAVGVDAVILHFNGLKWARVAYEPDFIPWHVWGTSSKDVFVIGGDGGIVHYDGVSWRQMSSGTDQWLWDIWGPSGDAIFAVGSEGTMLFFDGSSWESRKGGGVKTLTSVWGTSFNNVFAASFEGDILHFDGLLWTPIYHNEDANLWDMRGTSSKHIVAVGDWGWFLEYSEE